MADSKFVHAITVLDELKEHHYAALGMLAQGLMPRDVDYWDRLSHHTVEQLQKASRLISAGINDEYEASTQQWQEVGAAVLERALKRADGDEEEGL